MTEIIEYFAENQEQLLALGAALMVLGGIIVKMTPTKVDDAWFKKIKGWFGK